MQHNNLWEEMEDRVPMWDAPRVIMMRYWSAQDMERLIKLARSQATTRQIAIELGRTALAVRLKASRMGLALTAHDVRRSAKRHAKRQGKAALAEMKKVRQRPRIVMTVDFDLTSLTRGERLQLAERLRALQAEEEGVAPVEAAREPVIPLPRRRLRVPAPYDPSAETSKRLREQHARRSQHRVSLGWSTQARVEADGEGGAEQGAAIRERTPSPSRDKSRSRPSTRTARNGAPNERDKPDDALGRAHAARLLSDPRVQARSRELEAAVRGRGSRRLRDA